MMRTPMDALALAMTPEEWAGTDRLRELVAGVIDYLAKNPTALGDVNCDGFTVGRQAGLGRPVRPSL